jgi:hypothetical protein
MTQKRPPYRLVASMGWAAAQAAVAWLTGRGAMGAIWAAAAGFVAGGLTAMALSWLAALGAGYRGLMGAGLILGLVAGSGALGLLMAVASFDPLAIVTTGWAFLNHLLSWSVLSAGALGLATGAWVRKSIPRGP